jgi:hypothetical protein
MGKGNMKMRVGEIGKGNMGAWGQGWEIWGRGTWG